jgi:hypothetical protein
VAFLAESIYGCQLPRMGGCLRRSANRSLPSQCSIGRRSSTAHVRQATLARERTANLAVDSAPLAAACVLPLANQLFRLGRLAKQILQLVHAVPQGAVQRLVWLTFEPRSSTSARGDNTRRRSAARRHSVRAAPSLPSRNTSLCCGRGRRPPFKPRVGGCRRGRSAAVSTARKRTLAATRSCASDAGDHGVCSRGVRVLARFRLSQRAPTREPSAFGQATRTAMKTSP